MSNKKNNAESAKPEYDLDKEIRINIINLKSQGYFDDNSSSASQTSTYSGDVNMNYQSSGQNGSDKKSSMTPGVIIIISVMLFLFVLVICIDGIQDAIEQHKLQKTYNSAIELMMNDEYDEAYDMLFPSLFSDDYLEARNLSWLCEGMIYYEKEKYKMAYSAVKSIDNFDSLNDAEQIAHMTEAINTIEDAYEEYEEQEAAAKAAKETAEEAARALSDPYGAYNYSDSYEFYYDHVDDFEEYTDAVEYWNKHHGSSTSSSTSSSSGSTSSSSSSGKSSSSSTKKDPYNASDYPDAEEFYYYHTDDFIDYEEAEDYWNKYH